MSAEPEIVDGEVVPDQEAGVELVVHPHTGEIVSLNDEDEKLVALDLQLQDFAEQIKQARTLISEEFVHRLDKRRKWTRHVKLDGLGAVEIKSSSDAPSIAYDADQVAAVCEDLVSRDVIDDEAMAAAVEYVIPEPRWVAKTAGINALIKLSGPVEEALKACRVETPKGRRTASIKVTVKR